MRAALCLSLSLTIAGLASPALAQPTKGGAAPASTTSEAASPLVAVEPLRGMAGVLRPMPISVSAPAEVALELRLVEPTTQRVVAFSPIVPGERDLTELFPVLWTQRDTDVLFLEAYADDEPVGPPLVVEPLLNRRPATNELTHRLLEAYDNRDSDALTRLLRLDDRERARLRRQVHLGERDTPPLVGMRIYTLQRVILETDRGDLAIRLRPDHAPRTTHAFLRNASNGLYDGLAFHRVIRTDAQGRRVLVQTGDPTGTGRASAGPTIDFEPSALEHAYGVVSLARPATDPNAGGSQFFITLSREAGRDFDGRYTSFAEVVDGAPTLEAIALSPLGLSNPDDPSSPRDRPLEPAIIERVRLVDELPLEQWPGRIRPSDAAPVGR